MAAAPNADIYAASRLNIFFKGVVPSLDGQCVSLVKWFMQEMSAVPNPQAARGDARYVGRTLVAQGHAIEVPYADRRRGDIICYERGVYGHIGVQLSAGRVFEQNVNMGGVASKIVDGARVYASRIGSENESWRTEVHVYRLKTYREGSGMVSQEKYDAMEKLANEWHQIADDRQKLINPTSAEVIAFTKKWLGRNPTDAERNQFTSQRWMSFTSWLLENAKTTDPDPEAAALVAALRAILTP